MTTSSDRPWYLYVAKCSDGSFYTGITIDIQRRIGEHNAGRGARYTAARRPIHLLAAWRFPDQVSAMKAERGFKSKRRRQKEKLITSGLPLLDGQPVAGGVSPEDQTDGV